MSLSQISMDLVLIAGRAVFLVFCFVLAAVAFTRWRRAAERSNELSAAQNANLLQRLGAIEGELAASREQLSGAREQISALGAKLEDSEQRRTPAAAATAAPSYQIAIRLAKSGAPREELMASCGLSRQEAELVQRLHAPPKKPKLAAAS